MSKFSWTESSKLEIESRFSMEKKVAIGEPVAETRTDGMPAVRPTNLADVVRVENATADGDAAGESSDSVTLGMIRNEGNKLFSKKDWAGAVNKYSDCINQALSKLGESANTSIQQELMLAYSNRAEARLRLWYYEEALVDANEALKIDPVHVKTLVRKGKAAHKLQFFEKACEAFKAALRESPEEDSIMENLKASTTALEQSSTGEYKISWFCFASEPKTGPYKPPICADFLGPVEIRPIVCGRTARGLFATRNVKAGEVLYVSNPLAYVQQESVAQRCTSRKSMASDIRRKLLLEMAKRVKTSKRHMAQLHSLCGNRKDNMVIPSMELFRPGSEWVPEDWDKFKVDVDGLIDDFESSNIDVRRMVKHIYTLDGVSNRIIEGIWVLPSFMNHSCAPNVINYTTGGANFARAAVDISEGEEMTFCCFDTGLLYHDIDNRRQCVVPEEWKCARCALEETLRPKLSNIMKVYPDLSRAFTSGSQKHAAVTPQEQQTKRDLAKLADAVEVILQSEGSELGPRKQGWIRASFLSAYHAKCRCAEDNGDLQSEIALRRLMFESVASVCVGKETLPLAKGLFREVERRFPESSETYQETLDRVLMLLKSFFGDQGKETFIKALHEGSDDEVLLAS